MRSVPVLNDEEWSRLQDAVQSVKYKKQKGSTSPLVGVTFCAKCQNAMYDVKAEPARGKAARYRCNGNKSKGTKPCPRNAVKADEMQAKLTEFIVETIGHLEVMESIVKVDDRRAARIAVIDGKMTQYTKEFQAGRLNAVAFGSLMSEAAGEREKVTQSEGPKPVTQWVTTGKTYKEWWETSTQDVRREFLHKHDVRVHFQAEPQKLFMFSLGDLLENLQSQGLKVPKYKQRSLLDM